MKKLLLFFFLLNSYAYAQDSTFAVYLGCYSNGDTIPTAAFEKINDLSLLKDGAGQNEASLYEWQVFAYTKGKIVPVRVFARVSGSPVIMDKDLLIGMKGALPDKIVIQSLKIKIKKGDKTVYHKLPAVTFYRAAEATKKCN